MPTTEQQEALRGGLLAPALAGFIAGSALQLQQAVLWPLWVDAGLLAGAAAALCLLARKTMALPIGVPLILRRPVRGAAVLAAWAAVAFALCGLRATAFSADALTPALEGRDVTVTGLVAAMPQRGEDGTRFRFEVESARADGAEVRLPPQVWLGWYANNGNNTGETADPARQPADLRAGERWQMTVRLKAPHGSMNPHGFDYELWLWEQGLQATGYVRAGAKDALPQRIGSTWRHPVERARQSVRDAVFARVADRKQAGVIAALVAGDQAAIERADWDVFRATGVAHLMSISGLHVTMFAWVAALLVGGLWRRAGWGGRSLCLRCPAQSAGLVGGVLLATGYALFSGWGVPSQRTVCMLATVGLLRLSGRRWPWPMVWLLTCSVVVALDPWALLQAGFWLSFVAVGVLFAADPGSEPGKPGDEAKGWKSAVPRRLLAAAREQWVVTVALAPLTLLLFGQVSVVGLLANALAIPWVTLVVTPLAMLGVAFAPLWDVAALALQGLGVWLQWLASWPMASVSMPAPALWAGAAGVAGGIVLSLRLPWPMRALGIPLLLPALLWQAPRPAPGEFDVLAADVGQGNALIIRTAGHTLVYDTGPRIGRDSDAGQRVLVPLLRAMGETVDTVMLSHRDADHTGGAAAVLAMQPQARLTSSIEDGHELQAIRRSARCVAGQHWDWDGVRFEVLRPLAADYDARLKSNGMSCVLRIQGAGGAPRVALLAGDVELAQEAELVSAYGRSASPVRAEDELEAGAANGKLKADLLLVPHHGSKTSSSPAFLDAVAPRVALVQAGYRNRFGHPAAPVVARYEERGVKLVDSARCGAARWSSGAPGSVAEPARVECQRDLARRYWHHLVP